MSPQINIPNQSQIFQSNIPYQVQINDPEEQIYTQSQLSKVRRNTGVFDGGFTAQAVQPGAGVLGISAE